MTRTRVRRLVVATSALAVVAVGYAAYAANADDPSYRTTRATSADLEQTLALSGTIEPVSRADLAFATSGTVDAVAVQAGAKVHAGQVLGTLDRSGLRKSVQQARATLASARAQLETDEAAQADAVSGSTSGQSPSQGSGPTKGQQPSSPSSSPSGGANPQGGDGGDSGALAGLAAEQHAVTTAQTTVSAALAAATQALAAQQAACATAFSTDPGADHSGDQACTDALAAVSAAQQQVATAQQALQDAIDALARTLTTAASSHDASAAAATSTGRPAIVLVAASGPTVTAATIAHDQAQIDQARADLLSAQQELATATVKAPFAGRVVEVSAARGDSVAAGTDVFVLVSQGTTTVQLSVTAAQAQQLKVGQPATATPVGSGAELSGQVSQVSTIPDSDGTYAVTITLQGKHPDLRTGLTAAVSVVTGSVQDVVTVPASAVVDGRVQVLKDGTVSPTRVTTGVRGGARVQITDALAVGDVVVLADLDAAIPTSDSQDQRFGPAGGTFTFNGPPGSAPGGGSVKVGR